jgi:hypothetical protein
MNMFLYLISCLALIHANYKIYVHTREETHRITCLQRNVKRIHVVLLAATTRRKLFERNESH